MRACLLLLLLYSAAAFADPTTVLKTSPSGKTLTFSTRNDTTIAVGGHFRLFRDGQAIGWGRVLKISGDTALGRLTRMDVTPQVGDQVETDLDSTSSADSEDRKSAAPSKSARRRAWELSEGARIYNIDDEKKEHLFNRVFFTIGKDFEEITLGPFRHPTWSLWFLGSGALMVADRPLTQFWQDVFERNLDVNIPTLLDTPFTAGTDGYLIAGLLGYYITSMATDHRKGQVAASLSFKAIIYSYLYSHLLLKTLFARNRPVSRISDPATHVAPFTTNPFEFFNFHAPYLGSDSRATAFPSFHWTMFFAVGRVLQRVYDSYWPYLITVLGLGIDLNAHRHWVSDMYGGAVTGIGIADVVYNNFMGNWEKEDKSKVLKNAALFPVSLPGGFGAYFTARF
ncbi:MAG: phosphatase PAP2 family protein [Bdellovibrionota bacterium]